MSRLVVVDADVLGRQRTGDETYVRNLLRHLPGPAEAAGLRIAAITRHPELLPDGVEAVRLETTLQELRMAWVLPRLLRRLGAALVHTQYAVPLRCPCPSVVTVHDLSFEQRSSTMPWKDKLVFRAVVPRAVRRSARVLTVSERSRRDIVTLYGAPPEKVVVTLNGVDAVFGPGDAPPGDPYVLTVGAVQPRKNQLAALAAAGEAGLPLVVVGPLKDAATAAELRAGGARLEGYVSTERLVELYRGARCVVQASHYEGFGLPVVEAMTCGTPVVIVSEPALVEIAGGAAVVADAGSLGAAITEALRDRDRLVALGLARAREFSWQETAEKTVAAYLEALG
jgi:glycosyltransferase involved in cell wall biosynthesis